MRPCGQAGAVARDSRRTAADRGFLIEALLKVDGR
jgi:hypothetical protein